MLSCSWPPPPAADCALPWSFNVSFNNPLSSAGYGHLGKGYNARGTDTIGSSVAQQLSL